MKARDNLYRQAVDLIQDQKPFVMAVVVAKSGSTPQAPGAKGLFALDGRVFGTIGGGCLEAECRRIGLELSSDDPPRQIELQLDGDFGWDDGLICGGRAHILIDPAPQKHLEAFTKAVEATHPGALIWRMEEGELTVEWLQQPEAGIAFDALFDRRERYEARPDGFVYAEPVLPRERLVIFGAGHVGAAIARFASLLDFEVIITDDRPTFASSERLPFADRVILGDPVETAKSLQYDPDTFVTLVTRGHRNDAQVLRELIHHPVAYLGMIGSRRKAEVMKRRFLEEGVCDEAAFDRVRSPMGLDIGSETVEEIALSIVAELAQVRASRRSPRRAYARPIKP
ncbi:MAG: XdhC family protein [Armatimonadetes bacterium]|nr:XdhC family protein [Armatimonadota bacterium]